MSLIDVDPMDSVSIYREAAAPGREIAEYRYKLGKARRTATRQRLSEITVLVDSLLPKILAGIPSRSSDPVDTDDTDAVQEAFKEVELLVGDSVSRAGRWGDLHRHLRFSEGHDWYDIAEADWPDVKATLEAATYAELDPLPVPALDLGEAAESNPTGGIATELAWDSLTPEGFERLLYNLLNSLPAFTNVQWLVHTNATDKGRDISANRMVDDGSGGMRIERVIVQAKHWRTKPVNTAAVADTVAQMKLWQPPLIHALIIATSGKFSTDGVDWYERHNESGQSPRIEAWTDSHLERMLASNPAVAASAGL